MQTDQIVWRNQADVQKNLSAMEIDWLFDRGSLTQRLTLLSSQRFSLEVLSEGYASLRLDECLKLQLLFPQKQWVREVILKGDNQSWVYARSIIIKSDLGQDDKQLTRLGCHPLGSVLFTDEQFQRSLIEVANYPVTIIPVFEGSLGLWGRRSTFSGQNSVVLVQEIFLPKFWQYIKNDKE
ncbi:chorismate--pyruvate lyase family protein [Commensalibacter oyaizuii]|uniref:Probable chorismate pyruvate-lyase n=1 Tax=Commensalibacter oyaizuii TaxID=3043873 RepID=A0ABT6Q0L7_9PROT|nr:chorismate lyase [Commensalibacter sp. TBRC 16381]MDI2090638.1 chorismate lyase [Commensalibacter sp. TBRC 16381]